MDVVDKKKGSYTQNDEKKPSATDTPPIVLTRETVKRLVQDIKEIRRAPLDEHGIYYHHDEENMLVGYALVVGPEDTPYFGGYYFFKFVYPTDYPHSPPVVTFHTNAEQVRFHPNLYKYGKVCISLLNTWKGPQWSSCTTLRTLLLTLCTLFTREPFLHEPGVTREHPDFYTYHAIVTYKNIDVAVWQVVQQKERCSFWQPYFALFWPTVEAKWRSHYASLMAVVEEQTARCSYLHQIQTNMYQMKVAIDWSGLRERMLAAAPGPAEKIDAPVAKETI